MSASQHTTEAGIHITGNRVHVFAPAKLNLYLDILGLRDDGYHDIESVMVKVDWGDAVSLGIGKAPPGSVTLNVPGHPELETQNNLAVKAVNWFRQRHHFDEGVHIHITKRIWAGAGLGGGSSDAAAVLRGLAAWSGVRLQDMGSYTDIAQNLGADVPFFVHPGHGIVRGIGDQLESLWFNVNLFAVVLMPKCPANTQEMYQNWDKSVPKLSGNEISLTHFVDSVKNYVDYNCGLYGLKAKVTNAFLPVVERTYPEVHHAFCELSEYTPNVVGLSGSGSALFVLLEKRYEAERLAQQINRLGMFAAVEVVSILHC